jgi:ABC-type spermidine/putrescine transport system permease subunit I
LANFRTLIDDPRFLNSVQVSLEWEILTVVATMAVAIPLAVLVFEATSASVRNALCVLFIVPALLPRVSAAFVWRFAFHPLFGLAVYPLRLITGHPVDLLADPHTPMLAVSVVDVWQWGLLFSVVIVKLLETLPPSRSKRRASIMRGRGSSRLRRTPDAARGADQPRLRQDDRIVARLRHHLCDDARRSRHHHGNARHVRVLARLHR